MIMGAQIAKGMKSCQLRKKERSSEGTGFLRAITGKRKSRDQEFAWPSIGGGKARSRNLGG